MAWRGIHLSRPCFLHLEHQALKMEFKDEIGGSFRVPLEDLSYLILDTFEVTLSARLLSGLSAHSVLVLGVDATHLPSWISLPWTTFHKHGPVLELQLNSSQPTRKQLWAFIVQKKVAAQADTLALFNRPEASFLRAMLNQIRSGDPDNIEARAARTYWSALFIEREFIRHADDLPNAMLNYGYSLVRSALARYLCAYGFIPQLGLHHAGASNAFNLADDLIEPYRPLVDEHVARLLGGQSSSDSLTKDHRRALTQLLESDVVLEDEVYNLMGAIEVTVQSLKNAMVNKNPARLLFPQRLPS